MPLAALVAIGIPAWLLLGLAAVAVDIVLNRHYIDRWRFFNRQGGHLLFFGGAVALAVMLVLGLVQLSQRAAHTYGRWGCRHSSPTCLSSSARGTIRWCANCGAVSRSGDIGHPWWSLPKRKRS
jgi:hypothetical protein